MAIPRIIQNFTMALFRLGRLDMRQDLWRPKRYDKCATSDIWCHKHASGATTEKRECRTPRLSIGMQWTIWSLKATSFISTYDAV